MGSRGRASRARGRPRYSRRTKQARTGTGYHRRVLRIWRAWRHRYVGRWYVYSVDNALGRAGRPDLVLIDFRRKSILVFDIAGRRNRAHLAKGQRYVDFLQKRFPGFRVRYRERSWRTVTKFWRPVDKRGRQYSPDRRRNRGKGG